MKGAVLVLAVSVVLASTCFSAPETGRTEVGGNFWFRYHMDRIDESTQRSGFNVERGYIGLGHTWTPRVSGQMTVNVFSSRWGDGMAGWSVEMRDAYLNLAYLVPHGKIRVGLQKNYFGTVHDWKYLTVRQSLASAVGVVEERDYGIAFLGTVPEGMGEWSVGIMNGEGFSSDFNQGYADRQPALMATVRLMPLREMVVGLSALKDKRYVYEWYETEFSPENRIGYGDRTAISAMGRLTHGPFSLLGEYLYYDYPIPNRDATAEERSINVKGTGFSVFPMVRLTEKFEVVGRYDMWDPDKDTDQSIGLLQTWYEPADGDIAACTWDQNPTTWWFPGDYSSEYYNVSHNVYTVGFNYNLTDRMEGDPGVIVQVNWQRMDPQEDLEWYVEQDDDTTIEKTAKALDPVDSFIVQLRWGWGGLDF